MKNVLFDNLENNLRSAITLDSATDTVSFTTWRSFDTQDDLDEVLLYNKSIPMSIASGDIESTLDS